jgi:short-subunit dehydrogenase involved in D-alanine esterification of teichoic acids
MSATILNTVLIIGATSGIGAGLARRLHAQGKKVIATGRRLERLVSLQKELSGLETAYFDITDIRSLTGVFSDLAQKHPDIDTVIINAGMSSYFSLDKPGDISPEAISKEVTTNLTGPIVLSTLLVPFFLGKGKPASILVVGSGLGYTPLPRMSVYCATKAAIHSFCVSLRGAVLDSNLIKVTEIVPPYVQTELDDHYRDRMFADMGGPSNVPKPMTLDDFLDELFKAFAQGKDEIGIGSATDRLASWRNAFGPVLERFHVRG